MKKPILFSITVIALTACSLAPPTFDPTISQGATDCYSRTTRFETTMGHASVTIVAVGLSQQLATVVVHDDKGPVFDGHVRIINPSLFGNQPQITVYRLSLDPNKASDAASSLADRGLYALQTQCHPVVVAPPPYNPY